MAKKPRGEDHPAAKLTDVKNSLHSPIGGWLHETGCTVRCFAKDNLEGTHQTHLAARLLTTARTATI